MALYMSCHVLDICITNLRNLVISGIYFDLYCSTAKSHVTRTPPLHSAMASMLSQLHGRAWYTISSQRGVILSRMRTVYPGAHDIRPCAALRWQTRARGPIPPLFVLTQYCNAKY